MPSSLVGDIDNLPGSNGTIFSDDQLGRFLKKEHETNVSNQYFTYAPAKHEKINGGTRSHHIPRINPAMTGPSGESLQTTLLEFIDELWKVEQHPSPSASKAHNLRTEFVESVSEPRSPARQVVSQWFSRAYDFVKRLKASLAVALRDYPGNDAAFRRAANEILAAARSKLANGLFVPEPGPPMSWRVQNHLTDSRTEAARRAAEAAHAQKAARAFEAKVQTRLHDIYAYFAELRTLNVEGWTYRQADFLMGNKVHYLTLEDALKFCPPGSFTVFTDAAVETPDGQMLTRNVMSYPRETRMFIGSNSDPGFLLDWRPICSGPALGSESGDQLDCEPVLHRRSAHSAGD